MVETRIEYKLIWSDGWQVDWSTLEKENGCYTMADKDYYNMCIERGYITLQEPGFGNGWMVSRNIPITDKIEKEGDEVCRIRLIEIKVLETNSNVYMGSN